MRPYVCDAVSNGPPLVWAKALLSVLQVSPLAVV